MMAKFNDTYLRPALDSLKGNAESIIESANSLTGRVNAESNKINNKSLAELTFRKNISVGYKVLLILIGVGLLAVLLAWAASIIIKALKEDTTSIKKIELIDQSLIKSDKKLDQVSASINELKSNSSDKLLVAFNSQAEGMKNLEMQVKELLLEVNEFKQKLPTATEIKSAENADFDAYTLKKFDKNESSISCYDNGSYDKNCFDTYTYSNGWSYAGSWLNGEPNGDGTLKFQEGVNIDAVWKNGTPIEIKKGKQDETRPLTSVVYFQDINFKSVNPKFISGQIGYRFDKGTDLVWKSAYCYLTIMEGMDGIMVDLSKYDSFDGEEILVKYNSNDKYSAQEFKAAQRLCRYRRKDFN